MFSRILAIKSLNKVSKHVLVTQIGSVSTKNFIVLNTRYLYVKTYDKDAGLETKRAVNKFSHIDEHKILVKRDDSESMNEVTSILINEKNNDPDIFGSSSKESVQEDEGDLQEEEYISRPTRRLNKLTTRAYAIMIKDHLNNHRLKEAIDILDKRMLKEDRVKPENYIYNLLISGCAKAGYTRGAFHLYTKMRQRGLKVKESTYTSLFNACANAPSRQDGLTRAIRLRESLLESGYEYNVKNYNVMIKTFGRWGDVKTAYILADEMRDKNLQMTGETFNFLLQACASDEKQGFRHCLLTWHKMIESNIQPDYYSFNAVLRCVRDCGFGDLDEMQNVLQQILNKNTAKLTIEKSFNSLTKNDLSPTSIEESSSESIALDQSVSKNTLQIKNEAIKLEIPNLLIDQPHLGSMVSLSELNKPHERFLLLGGLTGFLENMKSKNITPDIQTFTAMLEVIPPTNAAEKQVLTFIRKIGLKADVDFFNILIKKRAMRFDYEGGKEVLSMIRTAGLYPDIVTYGVLALGCTTIENSRELLDQMRHNGIRMNIQILGAMLKQGCVQKSFSYVCEIMQISLDESIRPNEIFLRHLNNFYLQCARAIDARYPSTKTKRFKKEHKHFCDKYRLYQEEHGVDGLKLEDAIKKIKERPYNQYKEEDTVGIEPLKNEKLARKNKLRKYTKKIKIESLKGVEDLAETNSKLLINLDVKTQINVHSLQNVNNIEDNNQSSNLKEENKKVNVKKDDNQNSKKHSSNPFKTI